MTRGRVLIVDDDAMFRFAMGKALSRLGFDAQVADSGEAALPMLQSPTPPQVALLDLRMRGMQGLDVLRRCASTTVHFIVLTGHGTVQAAVEAMKLGAYSFLEKPVDAELLAPLCTQAIEDGRAASRRNHAALVPPIIGETEAMEQVRQFVARVAPTDETVAIYGETGTGKEVVARHIHLASRRAQHPFVALNAACVQRDLFESELFGHRRGAFTGATSDREGLFRAAHHGTLFIDEVAELPLESQAKLLRALESRMIRPLGETRETPVDVRIVAATNRDLWTEVQAGRFRQDLYFRLQVFPIALLPLRQRPDDILPLAVHLLERIRTQPPALSEDAAGVLRHYAWPGNVRELLNVLRRAVLFAEGDDIDAALVRRMVSASVFNYLDGSPNDVGATRVPLGISSADVATREAGSPNPRAPSSLADVERAHITQVLSQMNGNVTRAAAALGIDRRTLQRKLRGYGIAVQETP